MAATTLLEVKFGSHLYGTDTPESDLDLKELYVPDGRDVVLGTYKKAESLSRAKKRPNERNTRDDVDVERFSLDRFLADLCDGQTWAIDVLFAHGCGRASCPTGLGKTVMNSILDNRRRLLSRDVVAFVGYARKQAARYGVKGSRMDAVRRTVDLLFSLPPLKKLWEVEGQLRELVEECTGFVSLEKSPLVSIVPPASGMLVPTHLQVCGRMMPFGATVHRAGETYGAILREYGDRSRRAHLAGGVDWKALSHAVRVNGEAVELLETGWVTFPRPDREHLVRIKTGRLAAEDVFAEIEAGLPRLMEAQSRSTLRAEPDRAWADELVAEVYGAAAAESYWRPNSEGAQAKLPDTDPRSLLRKCLRDLRPIGSRVERLRESLAVGDVTDGYVALRGALLRAQRELPE